MRNRVKDIERGRERQTVRVRGTTRKRHGLRECENKGQREKRTERKRDRERGREIFEQKRPIKKLLAKKSMDS